MVVISCACKTDAPEAFATRFIATDHGCVQADPGAFGLGDFVEQALLMPCGHGRSRGFDHGPCEAEFPGLFTQFKARNSVASVVVLCSWWVAAVVMGLLLHGDRLSV